MGTSPRDKSLINTTQHNDTRDECITSTTMNFGVLEVANSKATAAPGWAYVPDTGVNASVAALQPGRSKRARNQNIATTSDTTAKQDAKLIRELEELTKENHREVVIPIPVKKAGVGRGKFPLLPSPAERNSKE